MPLRAKIEDGKVTGVDADTAEELWQFILLSQGAPSTARSAPHNERRIAPTRSLPEKAQRLVSLLAEHPEGVIGHEVARHIGVETKGLGPVVVSVLKWAGDMHFMKSEVVKTIRRRESGQLVSRLKLGERFLAYVREHGMSGPA